jgi:hypothetical protein
MIYSFLNNGEPGRIDAIGNFEIILIIIVEYFVLKKQNDLWLKITAFVLSFVGVVLLGMY